MLGVKFVSCADIVMKTYEIAAAKGTAWANEETLTGVEARPEPLRGHCEVRLTDRFCEI